MHELAILQHAQDLRLRVHAHSADLIEKERAPVGHLEQPLLRHNCAGKSAFDVSKQRGFQQVGRRRSGVDRNEGPVAPRGIQVNRLGDQLLARPAFALQQHRRAAGCNLRDQVENLEHGFALAHDVLKVVTLFERALELNVFFFRFLASDGRTHVGQQFFVVPRLLDEVCGSGLHGAHRVLHRAIGRDHDDGLLRVQHSNLRQHVHPVLIGERQVEQDHVKGTFSNLRHPFTSVPCHRDCVALELQERFERFPNFRFVVDDEDSARAFRLRAFRRTPPRDCRDFRYCCQFRHGRPSSSISMENPR